ncbi:cobalamin biosynthesis protein [Microvirga rosea]|uniref:cobalamin biosynthesis protein n=1 Tax=Microvirga rosea TaxID=2715425 RepID=UPI001D0BE036|nr:cobalamin biosynthesis protein [Microvirga rosea]MCB8820792.1 cobalamin biosynthesis protein [Microvirga rosea]
MIVAGVGFKRSADADEIVRLVNEALSRATARGAVLDKIATIEPLATLPAFKEAARRLSVPPVHITEAALMGVGPRVRTHTARSMAAHGVGSVAEAAALAAGGPESQLILERIASASVTCALVRRETAL